MRLLVLRPPSRPQCPEAIAWRVERVGYVLSVSLLKRFPWLLHGKTCSHFGNRHYFSCAIFVCRPMNYAHHTIRIQNEMTAAWRWLVWASTQHPFIVVSHRMTSHTHTHTLQTQRIQTIRHLSLSTLIRQSLLHGKCAFYRIDIRNVSLFRRKCITILQRYVFVHGLYTFNIQNMIRCMFTIGRGQRMGDVRKHRRKALLRPALALDVCTPKCNIISIAVLIIAIANYEWVVDV